MLEKNQVHKHIHATIYSALINSSTKLNRWRRIFIIETLLLFLGIQGRINFLQLARFSSRGEQSFRQQFEKPFDFMEFNTHLVNENFSSRRAIAIDPSHITKSGKKTPYLGSFWSGCAKAMKKGLEIMGVAAIDVDSHQALHLEAIQTPPSKTLAIMCKSLIDWYLYLIKKKQEQLLAISSTIVADAYFAKLPFVKELRAMRFHLVSRLQNNASLYYLYTDKQQGKRGRPKKYDGKVDYKNPELSKLKAFQYKSNTCYYTIVHSVALKCNILLIIEQTTIKGKTIQRMIFSTDITANHIDVLDTYHARFLIEFQFRDAKQATGLTHSQARSLNKLHTHFNFALTAVNLAKIAHWNTDNTSHVPFSISDIKILIHNKMMVKLFIRKFGINPNSKKNHNIINELLLYGVKTA